MNAIYEIVGFHYALNYDEISPYPKMLVALARYSEFVAKILYNRIQGESIKMNHKDGKLAKKIIELQNEDGTWGQSFHSLSQPNKRYPLTTEQALRRLKVLGFTINDTPIRKAVDCMTLHRRKWSMRFRYEGK